MKYPLVCYVTIRLYLFSFKLLARAKKAKMKNGKEGEIKTQAEKKVRIAR